MDRGGWQAKVHGGRKELDKTERLHFHNLYAEYIMQNPRLDEAQAGIKIARKNINNFI